MTSSQDWGLARRIGFRFGVVFGALLIYPFPIDALPKMGWLTEPLRKPLVWATQWFGQAVLGIPDLAPSVNGSGDQTFDYVALLVFAILAAIGTIAWSAVERSETGGGDPVGSAGGAGGSAPRGIDRRRSYPRLAVAARVVLRYSLAHAMLVYGFAKIWRLQFGDLSPAELSTTVGECSPMGLLWRFMDYSTPYTVFGGLCEAIPGVLLLWRRTAPIGAVMVIAVMTNVVMLNFSYDVCVKLYSMQLLVMAWWIALPDARRLLAAALGRATAEVPPRARMSPRRERVRQIAKAVFVIGVAVGLYPTLGGRDAPGSDVFGNWVVDALSADGVEHPPLATDPVRWQRVAFSTGRLVIWRVSGDRDPQITEKRGSYPYQVDAASHTVKVTIDPGKKLEETWQYARPAPDRLVIDGVHLGASLHVALHPAPAPLLVTRGFHWINESPFSR